MDSPCYCPQTLAPVIPTDRGATGTVQSVGRCTVVTNPLSHSKGTLMPDKDTNGRRGRWQGFDFGGGQNAKSPRRFILLYILGALVILFLFQSVLGRSTQRVDLNRFFSDLRNSQVKEVSISGSSLAWKVRDGAQFTATLPPNYDPTA